MASGTWEIQFSLCFRNYHIIIDCFTMCPALHTLMWCEKRFSKTSTRKCSRAWNKAWLVFPEISKLTSWSQGHLNWIDWLHTPTKLAGQTEASQEEGSHLSTELCVAEREIMEGAGGPLIIFGLSQDPWGSELQCPLFLLPVPVQVRPLNFLPPKVRNPDFYVKATNV